MSLSLRPKMNNFIHATVLLRQSSISCSLQLQQRHPLAFVHVLSSSSSSSQYLSLMRSAPRINATVSLSSGYRNGIWETFRRLDKVAKSNSCKARYILFSVSLCSVKRHLDRTFLPKNWALNPNHTSCRRTEHLGESFRVCNYLLFVGLWSEDAILPPDPERGILSAMWSWYHQDRPLWMIIVWSPCCVCPQTRVDSTTLIITSQEPWILRTFTKNESNSAHMKGKLRIFSPVLSLRRRLWSLADSEPALWNARRVRIQ